MRLDDLREMGERLRTQDNLATAHPIFLVEQQRRIYGVDSDHTDDFEWLEGESVGYTMIWEFVTCCFSQVAAQSYIDANRHNLKEPRIYVASAYRNPEWIAVRKRLMDGDDL